LVTHFLVFFISLFCSPENLLDFPLHLLVWKPGNHNPLSPKLSQMASGTRAIVASAPGANHEGGHNWGLQDLTLRPLKDDEVLVQIIATGICHTDLFVTSIPVERGAMTGVTYPKVVGHEGELAVSSSTPVAAAKMGMTEGAVTLCIVLTVLEQVLAT
jgi:hypothetical protein